MEHDAWFFVGVFVFIFLIWIATGGPLRPLSFAGPTLAQPQELGGGGYLELPRAPFGIGGSHISLPRYSGGTAYYQGGSRAGYTDLYGVSFGTPSPYRGIISMNHYVSNASSTNPRNEYITITVNTDTYVNVSGWKLVSEATSKSGVIPRGVKTPVTGVVNPWEDIVLGPGERAVIVSGKSPTGVSFRENRCTGYLNTFQQFSPPLSRSCPAPLDELAAFYGSSYVRNADCLNYVDGLARCETILRPPKKVPATCRSFVIEKLNYNGCVATHRDDVDFNGDMWRIYLGLSEALWRPSHEVVKLLDAQGKTVDAFSY